MWYILCLLYTTPPNSNNKLQGAFNAPIIGVFLLASLFPFANKHGAKCGLIAGFSVGLWLSIGSYLNKPIYSKLDVSTSGCTMINTTINDSSFLKSNGEALNLTGFNKIYSVSYLWFASIGAIVTILVGVIVSIVTGGNKKDYNQNYQKVVKNFLEPDILLYNVTLEKFRKKYGSAI
jgi:sodium-coupled monocarboxylate transporter 8/12